MVLDSNIIIYSTKPEYPDISDFVREQGKLASAVSYAETLGYHKLSAQEKQALEAVFANLTLLPVTQDVIDAATKLRQQKKMSLGDAIIAATCLVHNQALVTRNTADFDWIAGMTLYSPFDPAAQIPSN